MVRKSSQWNKTQAFSFNHFTSTQPVLSAGTSAPAHLIGTIIFQTIPLPLHWCIMGERFRHQSCIICHCTGRFLCHVMKILTAFSCSGTTLLKNFHSNPNNFNTVQLLLESSRWKMWFLNPLLQIPCCSATLFCHQLMEIGDLAWTYCSSVRRGGKKQFFKGN